ncbi:MAG: hypothetical protein HY717_06710 [Planctomycetes bacterium]|nr:hypothetical protein [Planctomycetota bacterium]
MKLFSRQTACRFFKILLLGAAFAVPLAAWTDLQALVDLTDIILRGDANNSGLVSAADANYINNYLFSGGPAPSCMDAADANDDGQVDISDSIYLMEWLYSGGPPPPAPGPFNCGQDPTSDSLTCVNSSCD